MERPVIKQNCRKAAKNFLRTAVSAWALIYLLVPAGCGDEESGKKPLLSGDCRPGVYPRLVMCPNEIETARSRIEVWPYSVFYGRAVERASAELPEQTSDYNRNDESNRAKIAKSSALYAFLEDKNEMADRSKEILSGIRSDWTYGVDASFDAFITISGTLVNALGAYDLLKGGGFLTEDENADISTALEGLAEKIYDTWIEGTGSFSVKLCQNNYNTKLSSSLGIAAMMLDGWENGDRYLNFAMTELNRFYNDHDGNIYLSEEGVCNEGPHYFNFGQIFAPHFAVLYYYMKGKGGDYVNQCHIAHPDSGCTGDDVYVEGILTSPRFEKAYEWMVKIRLPGGLRPPIDEATSSMLAGGPLWQYMSGNDLMATDFLNANSHLAGTADETGHRTYLSADYGVEASGELLARVDFSGVPDVIDLAPTQIFAESGMAIFRNNWEHDGIYAVLLGENGMMRSAIHNHADPSSFMLYAFGEMLAMETGYYEPPDENGSVTRLETSCAQGHNMILVNGEGPPDPSPSQSGGADAFIKNPIDTDGLDYAEALTEYQNVKFTRSLVFAGERYIVIRDFADASSANIFSWRLHGYGGGASLRGNYEPGTFVLSGGTATWERPLAKVRLVLHSDKGAPALTSALYNHEWYSGHEGSHNYIDGNVTTESASPDMTFLAVVYPQKTGREFPAITVIDAGAGRTAVSVTGDGRKDLAFSRTAGGEITFSAGSFGTVKTDALFFWAGVADDGRVEKALIKGGTKLQIDGKSPETPVLIE